MHYSREKNTSDYHNLARYPFKASWVLWVMCMLTICVACEYLCYTGKT